jgi:hypothetical protein
VATFQRDRATRRRDLASLAQSECSPAEALEPINAVQVECTRSFEVSGRIAELVRATAEVVEDESSAWHPWRFRQDGQLERLRASAQDSDAGVGPAVRCAP